MPLSPLQLEILICAHTGEPKVNKHINSNDTWKRQTNYLIEYGIIKEKIRQTMVPIGVEFRDCDYCLTEKGQFFFNYLLAVPFPSIEYKIVWE